jgi:DNA-binding MarR family transcriptional regulator
LPIANGTYTRILKMRTNDLFKPPKELRELTLLQELEDHPIVSQRELSKRFDIALGVTNACLRKMAQRGWIRTMGSKQRRIGYYLTPMGYSEKSKLALQMFSWTVKHYSALKKMIAKRLLEIQDAGTKRIVFYGVDDEMEIAFATLQELDMKLVGIIEDEEKVIQNKIFGFELKGLAQVKDLEPDAIVITSLSGIEEKRRRLTRIISNTKIRIVTLS